jgi:hypothetical protein
MNYKKEELEKLIFEDKMSYRAIGRKYGVSDTYIKKICKKLEIKLPKRANFINGFNSNNKGKGKVVECKYCKSEMRNRYHKQKYCSQECDVQDKIKKKYQHYLDNQKDYCRDRDMKFVKKHLLKEQEYKCEICKMKNEWNEKEIVFVLDHIDGDASNNMRNNLRLVCPNCDSQLPTYKSKNKNSSRKERYLKNYKN